MKMKRILLTGANGFIGKNLMEGLEHKYEVFAPQREELDLRNTENVCEFLQKNNFDIIIHSANTNNTRNRNTSHYDVLSNNMRMFFNLERNKHLYGKMIYFGSGAEYGADYYIPRMNEEYFDSYIPTDSYGFSKYMMSKNCRHKDNIFDLRLFGVYGKYEEWERRFISNAICRALVGKDITIERNVFFDYLWIDDLVKIVQWFISENPKHNHYNVCSGRRIDLYRLACMVKSILGSECDIIVKEPGWKKEYTGSNDRLIAEIGEFHFTEYQDAIARLCDYYKNNLHLIDIKKLID